MFNVICELVLQGEVNINESSALQAAPCTHLQRRGYGGFFALGFLSDLQQKPLLLRGHRRDE